MTPTERIAAALHAFYAEVLGHEQSQGADFYLPQAQRILAADPSIAAGKYHKACRMRRRLEGE